MITPAYCQNMARYNTWQNNGLREMLPVMSKAELTQDRGAFFGSILATVNHLLWADLIWLARLGVPVDVPPTADRGVDVSPTVHEWAARRFRVDGTINRWADGLRTLDLTGQLSWTNTAGQACREDTVVCIMHFFNHQTHHRGQVHAMLTAAGYTPADTDLPYMRKEA